MHWSAETSPLYADNMILPVSCIASSQGYNYNYSLNLTVNVLGYSSLQGSDLGVG